MSQGGYLTLTGYVTAEPKLWHTARAQVPVATIRVGSTPRRLDRETGEWQDGETSYYTVRCWRRLAENVHGSLRKGDMIIVRGRISTRTWVDDQQRTRTEVQVEADSVGHDLSFGWSRFIRGMRVPPGSRRGVDEGEAARQDVTPGTPLPGDGQLPGDDGPYEDGPYEDGSYEDELDLPQDEEYGGREAGLVPGGPDGLPGKSAGDERVPAGLAEDLGQPSETGAPS